MGRTEDRLPADFPTPAKHHRLDAALRFSWADGAARQVLIEACSAIERGATDPASFAGNRGDGDPYVVIEGQLAGDATRGGGRGKQFPRLIEREAAVEGFEQERTLLLLGQIAFSRQAQSDLIDISRGDASRRNHGPVLSPIAQSVPGAKPYGGAP